MLDVVRGAANGGGGQWSTAIALSTVTLHNFRLEWLGA